MEKPIIHEFAWEDQLRIYHVHSEWSKVINAGRYSLITSRTRARTLAVRSHTQQFSKSICFQSGFCLPVHFLKLQFSLPIYLHAGVTDWCCSAKG